MRRPLVHSKSSFRPDCDAEHALGMSPVEQLPETPIGKTQR
jgi:hypothetical protein